MSVFINVDYVVFYDALLVYYAFDLWKGVAAFLSLWLSNQEYSRLIGDIF